MRSQNAPSWKSAAQIELECGGEVTSHKFAEFSKTHPSLLFPAFQYALRVCGGFGRRREEEAE